MAGLVIRYHYVGKDHKIARAVFEGVAANTFWKDMLDPVPNAIIACDEGKVVAWTRYELAWPSGCDRGRCILWACGTWVEPNYRGLGLSHVLWGKLMKRYRPARVNLRTISIGGRVLSAALVRWFPKVTFEVAA